VNDNVNSFFERVKRGAAQAGKAVDRTVRTAGEKTGEVIETAKLNLHIADLQMRVKDVHRDIGALVYATYKNPNTDTDKVDKMLEELDSLHREIAGYRERVSALKLRKLCGECNAEVGRKDEYCRYCGAGLEL
jgi:hypothetical protein